VEGFNAALDGVVTAIIPGPTAGTAYIAGRFSNVANATEKRNKVALINVSDGSVVSTFRTAGINGAVTDLALDGNRLLMAGNFTTVSSQPRGGLASVNATTGALDDYLTVNLTENHSWTEGSVDIAKAPVGADKLALSPDGDSLVVIGNFRKANGDLHDQIVRLNLGDAAATIANWNTKRYEAVCLPNKFDSYVRDVAFSPDGEYFVVVTTGGGAVPTSLCDTAARWESDATGAELQPTWSSASGGDTILSVGISEKAVYIGGHMRWMNNALGRDIAGMGAVPRASIAALEPTTGIPTSWNPGRNPRGYGITEMLVTPQGLWIGNDQEWIGNQEFKHDRIAFFPLAGGATVHTHATKSLPGKVYTFGANPPSPALIRVNAGGPLLLSADGGPNWQADSATAPSPYHNAGQRTVTYNRGLIPNVHSSVSQIVQREIWDDELLANTRTNVNWAFPVARGTAITVKLYFASRCSCTVGSRKFHINIDGVRKVTDFDPVAAAGGNEIGIVRAFDVTSDGSVNVDLIRALGHPTINGIEIFRRPAPALTGNENKTFSRTYDGGTTVGTRTQLTLPAFAWGNARGAFMVGDTLFIGHGATFYRAPFNGTTFGPATQAKPYFDPKWDVALTGSGPVGQTFKGAQPDFFAEMPSVTGQFFDRGKLYYTLAGRNELFWRWFSPDSGIVGATRNAITAPISMSQGAGMFISGDKFYIVSRNTGALHRMDWTNGAPAG
ncbi:MAG TPA: malectin domain-containing carbohydrate-binding protein, partial [Micromonosporaceae bacterium]|nr:malectin domain-containing carbohydrate-binding protein [Micromonosporaceae bacterium]